MLAFFKKRRKECVYACVCDSDNSLPELSDGGGEVGDVGRQPHGLVLADGVLHAAVGVPGLLAPSPGKFGLKALEQVVESPGQDHNVVDVQQRHDDKGGVANTCKGGDTREDGRGSASAREAGSLSWLLGFCPPFFVRGEAARLPREPHLCCVVVTARKSRLGLILPFCLSERRTRAAPFREKCAVT